MSKSRPAGTPIWVELGTSDVEAAKKFYGGLFGWEAEEIPMGDAPSYFMFKKDGKYACGMSSLMHDDQPVAWNSYIQSDDVAADVKKVLAAGGSIIADTMEVPNMGTFAVLADDQGAVFSLWKGVGGGDAADDYNKPGFHTWNEVVTKDIDKAQKFYKAAFGWEATVDEKPEVPYTEFKLDGKQVAGGYQMTSDMPPMPPHWGVYFAVADVHATKAKAEELGGKVVMDPFEVAPGTFIMVQDPQGGYFSAIQLKS